ncbi:MAG: hypothetical protein HEEMFOPI_00267 [Holosporales bacterium]
MNKLRCSFFSRCISVWCVICLLFQPLILSAQEIDINTINRIAVVKNQPSLEEWIDLRKRVNHEDGWQVVSTGILDVSFEDLAFLAKKSVFRNTGVLMCAVDEQTTILDLPILDNVNTIQFYGVSNSPTPIFRNVKMDVWINEGIIDFFSQGPLTKTRVSDTWLICVEKILENKGIIRSDSVLQIETRNQIRPLTGIVEGYALLLKGFGLINAVLISGYQEIIGEQVENPNKGTVDVEFSSDLKTSPIFFDWSGIVYAKGKTRLKIPMLQKQSLDAVVNCYFDTKGLDIEAGSDSCDCEMILRLEQSDCIFDKLLHAMDYLEKHLISLGIEAVSNTSYFGSDGLNFSFKGNNPGNLSVSGNMEVEKSLRIQNTDVIAFLEELNLKVGSGATVQANTWIVNGILDVATHPDSILETNAVINIGRCGTFTVDELHVTKSVQRLSKDGMPLRSLWENRGKVTIGKLKRDQDFGVYNSGWFCVKKNSSPVDNRPLYFQNNTGDVISSFDVDSFYDNAYLTNSLVIDGSIQSLKTIKTMLSEKSNAAIRFKQFQRAGGDIKLLFQGRDVCFASSLVAAVGFIGLNAKKLTIEKEAFLFSKNAILLEMKDTGEQITRIQMDGRLQAFLLTLKAYCLTGNGYLDGHCVDLNVCVGESINTDKSFHVGCFSYGPNLQDLRVQSKRTVVIDHKDLPDKTLLDLKGVLDVQAHTIQLNSDVKSGGKIRLEANEKGTEGLSEIILNGSIFTEGDIALRSSRIIFQRSSKSEKRIEGSDIYVDYRGYSQDFCSAFDIPKNWIFSAKKQISLLAIQACIALHGKLFGQTLSIDAKSVWINSRGSSLIDGTKTPCFDGFSDSIRIIVDQSTYLSLPVETDIFAIESNYFYPHGISVRSLDARTMFTKMEAVPLEVREASFIGSKSLDFSDVNITTGDHALEFSGFIHLFHDVKAEQACLKTRAESTVLSGKLNVGHLITSGGIITLTQGSELRTRQFDSESEQRGFHLLGFVRTQQKELSLIAPHIIFTDLAREDNNPFEKLVVLGKEGQISGPVKSQETSIHFKKCLQVARARIMSDLLNLSASNLSVYETLIFADHLKIESENADLLGMSLDGLRQKKAISFNLVADRAQVARARIMSDLLNLKTSNLSVYETLIFADHLKIESENADLLGMSLDGLHQKKAFSFNLVADRAQLAPEKIKAEQAEIKLNHYPCGLAGAIQLAHDLVECDKVKMHAIKESLSISEKTQWRKNLTLVVNDADIKAPLSSSGELGIETLTGITVSSVIDAQSMHLLVEEGNICLMRGFLRSVEDIKIQALAGNIDLKATEISAGGILLVRGVNLLLESLAVRSGEKYTYRDDFEQTVLKADAVYLQAQKNIRQIGIKIKSEKDTIFEAGSHIFNEALRLERRKLSEYKYGHTSDYTLTHIVPQHQSGGEFVTVAGGGQVHDAPVIRSKKVTMLANSDIHIRDVRNITEHEHKHKREGWFSRKIINKRTGEVTSKGADIVSEETTTIESLDGDVQLTNVRIQAPRTLLKATAGVVAFLQGVNESYLEDQQQKANFFWQSQKAESRHDKDYSACSFSGIMNVESKEPLNIEQVKGKTVDFLKKLQGHKITTNWLKEIHEHDIKEDSGLAGPFALVVSLAVVLATSGIGASIGSSVSKSMGLSSASLSSAISSLTQATFTTLCSESAIAIINKKGNLIEAAKSLATKNTLKALAFSGLTAGLTSGLASGLDINISPGIKTFTEHLKEQSLRGGINAGARLLLSEEESGNVLSNCLKGVAVGTLGGSVSNEIGIAYSSGDLNSVSHKLIHGALGATTGSILSDDPLRGALGGALGSFVSETVAETLVSDDIDDSNFIRKIEEEKLKKGSDLTREDVRQIYIGELNTKAKDIADWSKIASMTTALLAGGDVSVAQQTATNALDNNFLTTILRTACLSYSAYEIYEAYQEGAKKSVEQGSINALKQFGIDVVIYCVGGKIIEGTGKAVRYMVGTMSFFSASEAMAYVAAKNPQLTKAVSFMKDKIVSGLSGFAEKSLKSISTGINPILRSIEVKGLSWEKGIKKQGFPFEEFLQQEFPKKSALPACFKTFDFFFEGRAISAKTLDTQTFSRLQNPSKIATMVKNYINKMVTFDGYSLKGVQLMPNMIRSKELHLCIPKNTNAQQLEVLKEVIDYSKLKDVLMTIYKT